MTERDLCRACLKCGEDDYPELMGIWRDAEGSGFWLHPWCDEDSWLRLTRGAMAHG